MHRKMVVVVVVVGVSRGPQLIFTPRWVNPSMTFGQAAYYCKVTKLSFKIDTQWQ